jgi:hypothetical protein
VKWFIGLAALGREQPAALMLNYMNSTQLILAIVVALVCVLLLQLLAFWLFG